MNKDFEGKRWISGFLWCFSLPCTVVQLLVCSALLLHFGSTNYIDYTGTSECVTIMIVAGAHTMTIDCIENVIASKTMEIMAIFFLHPTAALSTSGNSITTSNIYTVQGP